jgi:hypothetical protein
VTIENRANNAGAVLWIALSDSTERPPLPYQSVTTIVSQLGGGIFGDDREVGRR